MHLQANEHILYKTTPFNSYTLIVLAVVLGIVTFLNDSAQTKHYLIFGFCALLGLLRAFEHITITNQRIITRKFLTKYVGEISKFQKPPILKIEFQEFRKYEWWRKLSKQDFQKFWRYKAEVRFTYFTQAGIPKPLEKISLSLYSKRQTDKIIETLSATCQLSPIIKQQS